MGTESFLIPRKAASLRTLVEDRLRDAIVTGHFAPGQRLVERELCELFGVGRTSIREAFRQLEAEGLVTSTPHKGPVVSTMSYEEAIQLYEVRILLEGRMGRRFAEFASEAAMAQLTEAFHAFEKAVREASADRSKLLDAKTRFYGVLMEGCGNVFVKQMLSLLHNRVNLLRVTSMTQPNRLESSFKEVGEIYHAIMARDGDRAEAVCQYHIEMAAKAALEYLGRERA